MDGVRMGVVGGSGRMGREIIRVILDEPGCVLAGVCLRAGDALVGRDAGVLIGSDPLGLTLGDDANALFAASDVVLDFTVPEASARHAALAAETGTALVIGTTGLASEHQRTIEQAARSVAIVQAANTSIGIALLTDLVRQVAATLGPAFDIEIIDIHHRDKRDAPSGTALALGEAAAAARGQRLDEVAVRGRDGETGPRPAGAIGFAALRGGDVVGEHGVIFAGEAERIELWHRAGSRALFARGAVRAARWVVNAPPGLHGMADVLGLGPAGPS